MTGLTERQKELLFEYCIGLTTGQQTAEAQELIFANNEAAGFYAKIKASLSPLDSVAEDACPDELAEGTVWRLKQAARSAQLRLEGLLAAERDRGAARQVGFWADIGRRLVTAAVFIVVGSVVITGYRATSNYAHQKYWQTDCASQLGRISQGIANYKSDNDGEMPAVASAAGAPWWKIGDQGPANQSNTRRMWLLVKNDYASFDDFVCPGKKQFCRLAIDPYTAKQLIDFPCRSFVTYSLRVQCDKPASGNEAGRQVLISDLNPLFEILPAWWASGMKPVELNDKLMTLNSSNHNRRGQNVLFSDGSCVFIKRRNADISMDDIFTIQKKQRYEGVEFPSSEADAFLAP
jgi:hypothetical protein